MKTPTTKTICLSCSEARSDTARGGHLWFLVHRAEEHGHADPARHEIARLRFERRLAALEDFVLRRAT